MFIILLAVALVSADEGTVWMFNCDLSTEVEELRELPINCVVEKNHYHQPGRRIADL